MKYRFANKERLLALGVYPQTSLKSARKSRDDARELLAQGIDPGAHRKAAKAARAIEHSSTFELVAREWWQEVHCHKVVETHAGRNLRRLEVYIFPIVGRRPIAKICAPEILECLRRIEHTGKIETAHRVKTLTGQVFRYGISTGRCVRDISQDLRDALRSAPTQHHPALVEPEEIRPLLKAINQYAGHPATCAALKIAPLLFTRPGELRQAEWASFDLGAAEWDYTPSKNGWRLLIPLPHQVVTMLRELQAITGQGRYVFPCVRSPTRPMSENTINAALHRLDFKGKMTAHGFRAMARTVLVEQLGFPTEHIEMQLAHTVRDPNGRAYNRTTFLEQRKQMLQAWADYLDNLRDGPI